MPLPASPRSTVPAAAAYSLALLMTGAAVLAAVVFDILAPAPNISLIFVLPVVGCAVWLGWRPAMLSAVASVLAYNFFLIEPRYTFRVAESANVLALVLLLLVAAIVSAVAAQARARALEAVKAAEQAAAINILAKSLVGDRGLDEVAQSCAQALSRIFGVAATVLVEDREEVRPWSITGAEGLPGGDLEAGRWAIGSNLRTRAGVYPAEAAAFDFWPVVSRQRRRAAIGLRIEGERPDNPDRVVEIVAGYLAVALDREAYAEELVATRVEHERERIRSDLLAAVSHDLRTPLSTILFAVQSLRRFGRRHGSKQRDELLGLAEEEASRLSRMVANLLDVNRLEAGAVKVRSEPAAPGELVLQALSRHEPALAGRQVRVQVDAAARPLRVDPGLFETALGNVLENAARYAPGAEIEVLAGDDGAEGWIEVADHGPGFPEPIEPLFARFARGVEGDGRAPGAGLGLSIARGFMEAQGGRVEAVNRPGKGASVRLIAPLAA